MEKEFKLENKIVVSAAVSGKKVPKFRFSGLEVSSSDDEIPSVRIKKKPKAANRYSKQAPKLPIAMLSQDS